MAIRTSYSQNSTYVMCPQHWKWKYVDKLESDSEGSSLYFGTAIDEAVVAMLKGSENYVTTFSDKWFSTITFKGDLHQIYDNIGILYSYSDFDKDVMLPEDLVTMSGWMAELGLTSKDSITCFEDILRKKRNQYKFVSEQELRYFCRASWLSLRRKGEILLEVFKTQFYPKIKKVVSVQEKSTITDNVTGDSITGTLDFVAELEGYDKPVILDLKTASKAYSSENLELSQQLPIYQAMCGEKYGTDLVGYVVLIKNLNKKTAAKCSTCSHVRTGKHKTCDNVIDDVRCSGAWNETVVVDPQIQVIIEQKTKEEVDRVLLDYGNIIEAMRQRIVYKDVSKCHNWYGSKCPYFEACHKNSLKGLRKKY